MEYGKWSIESRKPLSVYLIVIEKKQKEHQKEAGMLTKLNHANLKRGMKYLNILPLKFTCNSQLNRKQVEWAE